MVDIRHSRGTLSLTPDHVLLVDGAYVPARTVQAGALLAFNATVTAVGYSTGGIISPLTVSGHIFAAGPTGAPVAATVWPEWIADTMLATTFYPLPLSLASLSARIFPESVQVCHHPAAHLTRSNASQNRAPRSHGARVGAWARGIWHRDHKAADSWSYTFTMNTYPHARAHTSCPVCQAFYDDVLESFFTATAPTLKALRAAPAPVTALTLVVFDLGLTAAFVVYSLGGLKMLIALASLVAVAKAADALRPGRAK